MKENLKNLKNAAGTNDSEFLGEENTASDMDTGECVSKSKPENSSDRFPDATHADLHSDDRSETARNPKKTEMSEAGRGEKHPSSRADRSSERLRKMIMAALFIAISYVFRFVFHFNAGFLTFEFKDAMIAVGGLYLGPVYAIIMALAVALLELATLSGTGFYGLIMNFLAASAFAGVASLVYRFRRTFTGAILSLILGAVALVVVMIPANLLITPRFMGADIGDVVAMIPTLLLPFNLVKGVMNMGVVMLLYKPVTGALRHTGIFRMTETGNNGRPHNNSHTWISVIVALVLVIAAMLIFFLFLHGDLTVGATSK